MTVVLPLSISHCDITPRPHFTICVFMCVGLFCMQNAEFCNFVNRPCYSFLFSYYDIISVERDSVFLKKEKKEKKGELENGIGFP